MVMAILRSAAWAASRTRLWRWTSCGGRRRPLSTNWSATCAAKIARKFEATRTSEATSWRCGPTRFPPMIRRQPGGPANDKMQLSPTHDQAIAARMAFIVGGPTFDRLFAGVRFDEVVRDILFVYA